MQYQEIINFWFNEIDSSRRWVKDPVFDQLIKDRYAEIHARANRCELYIWRSTAQGRLAEIIVLDQFSRNIFRDSPDAFASDPLALALAQEAVSLGADKVLNASESCFLYMPFMHSESSLIHKVAVQLFDKLDNKGNLEFELKHKKIIDRFGRYPHRNEILNRPSTDEELEFLKQPGSGF